MVQQTVMQLQTIHMEPIAADATTRRDGRSQQRPCAPSTPLAHAPTHSLPPDEIDASHADDADDADDDGDND